jgi:hypothetical protein
MMKTSGNEHEINSASGSPGRRYSVTRRLLLKSAGACAAALALPAGAFAFSSAIPARKPRNGDGTLGKYLCSQVHDKMAIQLDEIIADPRIDGEGTALALMQARCPGCGQRVHPRNSAISAVIPKWQWSNPATSGLEA